MKTNIRESLLSWFTYIIGGFNSSPGINSKIELYCEDSENDEKVVRYLLKEYEKSIKEPLEAEILRLKSENYDLQRKLSFHKKDN